MVNQQLVAYLNQYKGQYALDQLKSTLLQQGYALSDVDEALAVVTAAVPVAPSVSATPSVPTASVAQSFDTSKAAVAYILTWLTGLIIYCITPKEDKFTRFHAMQAIFLGIAFVVIYMVISIFLLPLFFFGGFLSSLFLMPLIFLAGVAVIVLMAVSAYKGNKTKIPLIGNLAESIVEKN